MRSKSPPGQGPGRQGGRELSRRKARQRRRFGHVFPRRWKSGRTTWAAQWFDQTQDGKRVTRHFDTEKDAHDFLDELERRILAKVYETPPTLAETMRTEPVAGTALGRADEDEQPTVPAIPSFTAYAESVIENRLVATLAKGTLGLYRAALKALTAFYGDTPLDEITPSSWLDYRAWRLGVRNSTHGTATTVSPRTVNADQQFASRILNEAVLDGHIERNPLAGLRKLREPKRPRRYLSKDEIARLIEHSPKHFRPLVVAAVYTGARKSELTALRWSDIDFDRGKITLVRSKVGNVDAIDLHPAVRTALLRLRMRRKKTGPGDHVFLSRRGTPFSNVTKSWAIALRGAGLEGREGLTFHCLRHSFATHFLEGGGAVTDLQQQLGHAALATTQIYAASLSERRRSAVLALDFRANGEKGATTRRRARRAASGE